MPLEPFDVLDALGAPFRCQPPRGDSRLHHEDVPLSSPRMAFRRVWVVPSQSEVTAFSYQMTATRVQPQKIADQISSLPAVLESLMVLPRLVFC